MNDMAPRLGADVPFFLHGGTALGEGIGEIADPAARDRAAADRPFYPGAARFHGPDFFPFSLDKSRFSQ